MNDNSNLSNRQKDVITFIKKFIAKNGYSPSVRAIADGVHLNSPATVHVHIQNLINMGYLKRDTEHHNSLVLLVPNEFEFHDKECIEVPFIDKDYIEDFEHELKHPDDTFYLSGQMVGDEDDIFIYKVLDNNMKNIGIFQLDYLIVSRNNVYSSNDIVVVQNGNLHIYIDYYRNVNNEFEYTVLGKVISLYREFNK